MDRETWFERWESAIWFAVYLPTAGGVLLVASWLLWG